MDRSFVFDSSLRSLCLFPRNPWEQVSSVAPKPGLRPKPIKLGFLQALARVRRLIPDCSAYLLYFGCEFCFLLEGITRCLSIIRALARPPDRHRAPTPGSTSSTPLSGIPRTRRSSSGVSHGRRGARGCAAIFSNSERSSRPSLSPTRTPGGRRAMVLWVLPTLALQFVGRTNFASWIVIFVTASAKLCLVFLIFMEV